MRAKKTSESHNQLSGRIRILIVDDHPLVRESLKRIIQQQPDLEVCGETDNASQALELVAETKPHLVILDLTLKDSHGLELIKNLNDSYPKVLCLVFSMHEETLHAERVIRAGARGYVAKEEPPGENFTGYPQSFERGNLLERKGRQLGCVPNRLPPAPVVQLLGGSSDRSGVTGF